MIFHRLNNLSNGAYNYAPEKPGQHANADKDYITMDDIDAMLHDFAENLVECFQKGFRVFHTHNIHFFSARGIHAAGF